MIEMGLDILNPLQPECNDIEKITQEVKLRISQLAQGGGYILASAHSFPYPASNLQAFKAAAIEYGKIPQKWRGKFEIQKTDVEV